jgi:alkylation response protein AidB-like acyl-CoA dehydrogenase
MSDGAAVAVDRLGAGLVVLADPAAAIRPPTPPVADDYVTVLDIEAADGTTLLTEEEMNGRRAAVLARTQLGAAAEMLGVVDRLLDDAVAYAQQRRQFGRTVASYQSMQHLLAWAATERHQLISLYDLAVVRSTRGPVDALLSAAVKAMAGRVLHAVAQTAIQVTGGISFTWEYGLNRLHRRGLVLDQLAGSSADLLVALGRQVRTEGVVPELVDLCDVAD